VQTSEPSKAAWHVVAEMMRSAGMLQRLGLVVMFRVWCSGGLAQPGGAASCFLAQAVLATLWY
jgi:hypothetical protein